MKRLIVFAALLIVGSVPTALTADDDSRNRVSRLLCKALRFQRGSFQWRPPATLRGAISTKAEGTFRARLRKNMDVIDYELTYEGFEGTVTQAHIHFGQRHTVGGIVVWLCETAGTQSSGPAVPRRHCSAGQTAPSPEPSLPAEVLSPNRTGNRCAGSSTNLSARSAPARRTPMFTRACFWARRNPRPDPRLPQTLRLRLSTFARG